MPKVGQRGDWAHTIEEKDQLVFGRVYIGVDPGKAGGVALILPNRKVLTYNMPDTQTQIRDLFNKVYLDHEGLDLSAAVEQIGTGVFGGKAHSNICQLYGNYRELQMALVFIGIGFVTYRPQEWLAHYGLKKGKKETDTHWKKRLMDEALRLYPGRPITKNTADALLIAERLRQKTEKAHA